jgi:predicted nucleic acid-binding protein
LTLVLDSSVFLPACSADDGFGAFGAEDLVAPYFMWTESLSALHEAFWRHEVSRENAEFALGRFATAPVKPRSHRQLTREAWNVAERHGWAKTYDAEYVALAALLGCRLVTSDLRLRRGADRLGFVITPEEI